MMKLYEEHRLFPREENLVDLTTHPERQASLAPRQYHSQSLSQMIATYEM